MNLILIFYLSPFTKCNLRWIINLNVKKKNAKISRKIHELFYCINRGKMLKIRPKIIKNTNRYNIVGSTKC